MDVVEAGQPDRPRRGWAVGVVAVLLLGAGVYGATRPDPAREDARPSPAASTAPAPPLRTVAPEPATPGAWLLPPLGEATRIGYAITGPALRVVDVDSGEAREVTAPDRATTAVEPVGQYRSGWVLIKGTRCGRASCPSHAYHVSGGRWTEIGPAETAFLTEAGSVWVSAAPAGATPGTPRWVEKWAADRATRLGPRTALRPGERLLAATTQGPLVGDPADPAAPLYLIEDRTRRRRVLLEQAHVVAVAAGRFITWTTPGCHERPAVNCVLNVTDLRDLETTRIMDLPGVPDVVAVSPNGRYVAVARQAADVGDEPPVTVYDMATERHETVGGVTDPPGVGAMAWSRDGRWLVIVGPVSQRYFQRQVAVWRPGLETAYEGPSLAPAPGDALVVVRGTAT